MEAVLYVKLVVSYDVYCNRLVRPVLDLSACPDPGCFRAGIVAKALGLRKAVWDLMK